MLKGKGDTALFFMDKALEELKPYFQKRYPNNILKYVKLLHDNAHLHNAVNVTIFLEVDKEAVLSHPSYTPVMVPCDYFLFL